MSHEGRLPAAATAATAEGHVAGKSAPAVRSWVALDCTGTGTVLDVDKHAIMRRVQIHARDLRIIDPLLSYPSAILGRGSAIVLNLEHIKAIITADEVLLRDPSQESVMPVVEKFNKGLLPVSHQPEGKGTAQHEATEEDVSPFEFRALEVALEATCSSLDAQTVELENAAYPALDALTTKISSRNLDRVRKLKSSMTRLIARVQKVRDELERLLDDDNGMADLYLSRKIATDSLRLGGSPVSSATLNSPYVVSKMSRISRASVATFQGNEYDVEELEMLLEAYFIQLEATLNKLNTLREYVDDTEDYINFQLDNHRNQLIQVELFLSTCTVSFTFYSFVGAVFGMNIPYSWNDPGEASENAFKWVVGIGGLISALILIVVLVYARYRGLIGT